MASRADAHKLAADAAAVVKGVERVPDIPMFRQNTAAFVHEMAAGAIANVDGDGGYVRVQVLTNAGALDREKQIAVVAADIVRFEGGKLAEHWDVLQDEATQAESISGLPMFGDRFPD
jgi:predicted SnoaL-like aldol condensation-catalyzing enzyme